MHTIPRVGVAVLIFDNDKILLGKRKNAHGAYQWAPPGGHLEFGETPQECAVRETFEETGLSLQDTIVGPYTNDFFEKEQKHYITLFVLAKYRGGEPVTKEPDKCEGWQWFALSDLPQPLFLSIKNLLEHDPGFLAKLKY